MSERGPSMRELPSALSDAEAFSEQLVGRLPAVFFHSNGTLTPIGDRPVVQELMGVDDLVITGSHGFDIWSPDAGTLEHEASSGLDALLERVRNLVQDEAGGIEGASIEPKKASVAMYCHFVSDSMRPRIEPLVALDREEIVALNVSDDITDENAFEALTGAGIGVFVGDPDDPELAGRPTAVDFVLTSVQEVERFLRTLTRWAP